MDREEGRSMEEVPSDDDLVGRIRLGDEKAAEELIKRYYTSILYYCKRQCFNWERAEDLTQETFLKLFKNLPGYKGKRKFKAYLYTIAKHLCIDESRKIEVYPLENEEEIRDTSDGMRQIEDKSESLKGFITGAKRSGHFTVWGAAFLLGNRKGNGMQFAHSTEQG